MPDAPATATTTQQAPPPPAETPVSTIAGRISGRLPSRAQSPAPETQQTISAPEKPIAAAAAPANAQGQPPAPAVPGQPPASGTPGGSTEPKKPDGATEAAAAPEVPKPEDVTLLSGGPSTIEEYREALEATKRKYAESSTEAHSYVAFVELTKKAANRQGLDLHFDDNTGEIHFVARPDYATAKGLNVEELWNSLSEKDRELATEDPKKFVTSVVAKAAEKLEKKLQPTAIAQIEAPPADEGEIQEAVQWAKEVKQQDGSLAFPEFEKWEPVAQSFFKRLPTPVQHVLAQFPRTMVELAYSAVRGRYAPLMMARAGATQQQQQTGNTARTPPTEISGGVLPGVVSNDMSNPQTFASNRAGQISGRISRIANAASA